MAGLRAFKKPTSLGGERAVGSISPGVWRPENWDLCSDRSYRVIGGREGEAARKPGVLVSDWRGMYEQPDELRWREGAPGEAEAKEVSESSLDRKGVPQQPFG